MTIRHGTHITTDKRHHATVQRQLPPPLAPITTGTTRMARATPYGLRNGPAQPGKPVPDPVSRDPAQLRNPTTAPAPACFPHRETATAPRGFVLGRFSNAGNQRRAHRMPPLPPASENFTDSDVRSGPVDFRV